MVSLYGITLLILGVILVAGLFFWKAAGKSSIPVDSAEVVGSGLHPNYNSDDIGELERHVRERNFAVIEQITREIKGYPAEKQKLIRGTLTEPLFMAMADKREEVRLAAAEALKSMGDASIAGSLVQSLKEPNRWLPARTAEVLVALGQSAVPALLAALEDDDSVFRGYLIEILGEIGEPSSVSALQYALSDKAMNVRLEAARALGKIGNKNSIPSLVEALGEPEVKVVVQAVRSLGKIGGPEVTGYLGGMLSHHDGIVRFMTLDALRSMGSEGLKVIRETALIKGHPSAEKAQEIIREIEGDGASIIIRYK
ncbi:HEAT repeat domain-containing protein [Phosphitispora fastidiosa]|uniref:HEAT repeat domain-containing protein n=1 Tax=Phosphitispora fastidiosa TaxID=2837202 RepID=UPI001E3DE777|nr:HEAT repeat domain-containing protein [Phosphitispora fastidiosa]MBU7007530.1 HEAT repeat protein [Phosphitispora fastidiosa]